MRLERLLFIVVIILAILIVSIFIYSQSQKIKVKRTILTEKPDLNNSLNNNPDIIFNSFGYFDENAEYVGALDRFFGANFSFINDDEIKGDGIYLNKIIDGRKGVIYLHPKDEIIPSIQQFNIQLQEERKTFKLYIGLTNLSGKEEHFESSGCYDNIFKIYINNKLVDDITVDSNEGWKDIKYEITLKKPISSVVVDVISLAGGPCGIWQGENGGIDYLALK